jgi:hypothetical protein
MYCDVAMYLLNVVYMSWANYILNYGFLKKLMEFLTKV